MLWVMKRTKVLESIAYHWAGHAVAAAAVGARLRALSLIEAYASRGHAPPEPYFRLVGPSAAPDAGAEDEGLFRIQHAYQRRLENMALVCLAGPAAQRRFDPCGFRRSHGDADRRQALAILSPLAGGPEETQAYVDLIDLRARNFVAADPVWRQIECLAGELLARVTLSAAEVRETIKASSPDRRVAQHSGR